MITFFTIPKPFKGHISVIQKNAIQSWLYLHPGCEIILYGDEEGIRETADEFGLVHVPEIKKNENGTPFLDFVFNHAQSIAKNDTLCYANADIIFCKDFIKSIQNIKKDSFLAVGRRWENTIQTPLNFSDTDWENNLRTVVKNNGILTGPTAIDYFVFPKIIQVKILSFLVGRKGWDNWMIYHARKEGYPVIDISQVTTIIHQNHDYNHVPIKQGEKWQGPESDYNENLMGNKLCQKSDLFLWSIDDADYYLTDRGLFRRRNGILNLLNRNVILKSPEFLYPLIGFFIMTIYKIKIMALLNRILSIQ